jgi:hypothetical protein
MVCITSLSCVSLYLHRRHFFLQSFLSVCIVYFRVYESLEAFVTALARSEEEGSFEDYVAEAVEQMLCLGS